MLLHELHKRQHALNTLMNLVIDTIRFGAVPSPSMVAEPDLYVSHGFLDAACRVCGRDEAPSFALWSVSEREPICRPCQVWTQQCIMQEAA